MSSVKPKPLISLTTLDGERFEGLLHHLNNEANTVTLTEVRSFGTENRKSKKGLVQPDPNVRDIVCFPGKNLKEVNVIKANDSEKKFGKNDHTREKFNEKVPRVEETVKPKKFNQLFEKPATSSSGKAGVHVNVHKQYDHSRPDQKTVSKTFDRHTQKDFHKKQRAPRFDQPQPDFQKNKTNVGFAEDFDFDEHNEKFKKLDSSFAEMKVYDKRTSFFDNLPTRPDTKGPDAKAKAQEDRRKANEIDTETFGSEMISEYRPKRYHRNRYQKKKPMEKSL